MSDLYLIQKRGLYYRPDSCGYTGLKSEAGRYSFEDAAEIVGPNGPDGPQDGLSMWPEKDAPDFSDACAWDVRLKATAFAEGYAKGLRDAAITTGVKVKPLEWHWDMIRSDWWASGAGKTYWANQKDAEPPFDASAESVVVAQADYESRILSALQPTTMSVAEAARVEKWASELQEAITEMRYSILVQRASDRVRSVVQEMRGNKVLASPEGK